VTTTLERGASAETRACELLVRAGYQIVERNFRCKSGELDIVARDGDTLCFVEVRSRAGDGHGHAAETVGRRKQLQVARVAQWYASVRQPTFTSARFDVVAFTGDEALWIKDAFRVVPSNS
jgi:putative endonuclease